MLQICCSRKQKCKLCKKELKAKDAYICTSCLYELLCDE